MLTITWAFRERESFCGGRSYLRFVKNEISAKCNKVKSNRKEKRRKWHNPNSTILQKNWPVIFKMSRSWKSRKDWIVSDWRRLRRHKGKCKATFWTGSFSWEMLLIATIGKTWIGGEDWMAEMYPSLSMPWFVGYSVAVWENILVYRKDR